MPRTIARMIPAAALVLAAGLSTTVSAADATYRVVARTGQAAPGGGTFLSFSSPVITPEGRVAFTASLSGILSLRGVWSEGVSGMNNLQLAAKQGNAIPGVNNTSIGAVSQSASPIINASGEIVFHTPIVGAQAQFGEHAILRHTAQGLQSVAMPGQLVSLPCGGIGCQRWITDLPGLGYAFNAAGQVAFLAKVAGTAINDDNDDLLLLRTGNAIQVVIREGDTPPGTFGVVFGGMAITMPQLNGNGEILVRNYLQSVNTNTSYWSVWRGGPGSMSIVAAQNWLAPVGGTFSGNFIGFGTMGFNNAGQALFVQSVLNNQGDLNSGLWLNQNAQTQAVSLNGMPAPTGLTYNYPDSFTGSINASGVIAYNATVQGPGVNFSNDRVLIRRMPNGAETLIVREGNQVPGFLNGVVFSNPAWSGERVLNDGRIVFQSGLSGPGVHAGNDQAMWITRHGAAPALLLRTGQTMVIGGQLKSVQDFGASFGAGPETGGRTAVSELGQVVMRVTFTDATQAIIVASPESACPGDVNGDGVVNFADLNAVLGVFGHLGDVIPGDLDLDGDVDFADLNQVLSNFGVDCGI